MRQNYAKNNLFLHNASLQNFSLKGLWVDTLSLQILYPQFESGCRLFLIVCSVILDVAHCRYSGGRNALWQSKVLTDLRQLRLQAQFQFQLYLL